MHASRQRQLSIAAAFYLIASAVTAMAAFADCKANYDQSMKLLNTHMGKAKDKAQSADPDAFETDFRDSVRQLEVGKCLPELMSLIQHIQGEQQKYPHPNPKAKPAPIKD